MKLHEINNQIKKLERQAAEIRAKEYNSALSMVVSEIMAFNISLREIKEEIKARSSGDQLGGKTTRKRLVNKPVAKRVSEVKRAVAKYKGPNGELWSGRGLTPKWLNLLTQSGRSKEDFLIDG